MKSSEIRKEAREALNGKWGKAACITLVYLTLTIIVGFIEELVGEGTTLYNIIEIAYFIISIPISFGLIISFMKLKKGEEVSAFDFFNEGFSRFGKSFGIWFHNLLKLLLPIICFIVSIVLTVTVGIISIVSQSNYILSLLSTIFTIITIVWLVCKSLLYAMSYYISYDNPELSSKECVNRSAELMKGNRSKYLLLELSFIGWIILSVLTLGIGVLWLMPYMQVAVICFYEKISKLEGTEAIKNKE